MDTKKDTTEHTRDVRSPFLATAALFEGDFSVDWVQALAGLKTSNCLQALDEGMRLGFLIRKRPGFFCFAAPDKREGVLEALGQKEKEE